MVSRSSIGAAGGTFRVSEVLEFAHLAPRKKVPSGVGHSQPSCWKLSGVSSESRLSEKVAAQGASYLKKFSSLNEQVNNPSSNSRCQKFLTFLIAKKKEKKTIVLQCCSLIIHYKINICTE